MMHVNTFRQNTYIHNIKIHLKKSLKDSAYVYLSAYPDMSIYFSKAQKNHEKMDCRSLSRQGFPETPTMAMQSNRDTIRKTKMGMLVTGYNNKNNLW